METVLALLVGFAVGGLVGWLWATSHARSGEGAIAELRAQLDKADREGADRQNEIDVERQARVKAETQLAEAARNLAEQKALLDSARAALSDTFKALSDDALKSNNLAFLDLAKKTLESVVSDARGDLSKRQEAIDGLVKPLRDSLTRYDEHLRAVEQSRQKAYGSLEEQLRTLMTASRQLERETGSLVAALRAPQVRGQWGEMTLRRVVELAGMSDHCDFVEQEHVATESGAQRPDLVVQLPGERKIVIDAKVSLDGYLDATNADSEEERTACLDRHARQIKAHIARLAQKAYCDQVDGAIDFVVMFVPGESFLAAAVDSDHGLIEEGMKKRIVLATPTTLIALLRAIAYGWRQESLAANAQKISELGMELYERMETLVRHLGRIGKSLGGATEAYNNAVGSIERRVMPSVRRFRELGVSAKEEIPPLDQVDVAPRTVAAQDAADDAGESS